MRCLLTVAGPLLVVAEASAGDFPAVFSHGDCSRHRSHRSVFSASEVTVTGGQGGE